MPTPTGRQVLLVLLFSGLCFFVQLGAPKLWDRDEPRNARCAWEMWERQDWVVPTFNGELRTHKPVLLYWLTMTAYAVWGVSEFAARFWSATLSVGTVGLTYLIGRRLFDAQAAVWSALILSTTLMFNVAAHAATPDAALIFFSTLAITCCVYSQPRDLNPLTRSNRLPMAGAGIAMGLAVLAKGPIGFVLPVAVWGTFLWVFRLQEPTRSADVTASRAGKKLQEGMKWVLRRLRPTYVLQTGWQCRPLLITLLMLAVAVPWYVAVGIRTEGLWLREFFLQHNVGRAIQPMEGHGGNTLLFYPAAILVGFFPWSALTIPAGIWIAKRRIDDSYDARFGFLLTWLVVYVGAFSLAGTKLPSYVTPTYPALALMVGHFVAHWPRSQGQPASWWPQWSALTLIVVGGLIAAALPWAAHQYLPGEEGLGAIGVILLLGGALCLVSFRRQQLRLGMMQMAATSLCFIVCLFAWVAPRVSRHQQIDQLVASTTESTEPIPLASFGVHEPSWVFYAGQTVPLIGTQTIPSAVDLLTRQQGQLITTAEQYEQLRPHLPAEVTVVRQAPYFLKDKQLLLLGNVHDATAQRPTDSHR